MTTRSDSGIFNSEIFNNTIFNTGIGLAEQGIGLARPNVDVMIDAPYLQRLAVPVLRRLGNLETAKRNARHSDSELSEMMAVYRQWRKAA